MNNEKLKNKSEGYISIAKSFEEYYIIGKGLQNIGNLIENMAFHIEYLQAALDDKNNELLKLKKHSNSEEAFSQTSTQTEKVEAIEKLLKILKIESDEETRKFLEEMSNRG